MEWTKETLRAECSRLIQCRTINESRELLDIYSNFLFLAVLNHHKEPVANNADAEAKLVAQMMLTKALHLKSTIEGISFKSKNGGTMNNIIDPTVVAGLIRNIYETTGMFNLIYRNPKSPDEKNILYLLWVHAGLAYRQRFAGVATTKETIEKCQEERTKMQEIELAIEGTVLYQNLNDKNRAMIKTRLRQKEYLMRFDNNSVVFLNWQSLTDVMGFKKGIMDTIYTYFSLYTHPSNVSVFQFASMFDLHDEAFWEMTNFNLKNALICYSVFIADYINLFPTVLKTYESMDIKDQIATNIFNVFIRGSAYRINNSSHALE